MNRGERIHKITSAARLLGERDWDEIDLVLRNFSLPTRNQWQGTQRSYVIQMMDQIDDEALLELHDYLTGEPAGAPHQRGGPWEEGWFRLFLSHISTRKNFVGEVKTELADYGIDAFVAHDDIEPTQEWRDTIELALGTCDALAAFLHPGFHESLWTDQEVGYALATRVKIVPLMFGLNPHGFMGRFQGAQVASSSPAQVAEAIYTALLKDHRTRDKLETGIVSALADSQNYYQANDRSARLSEVRSWTPDRLATLERALENGQVAGAWRALPRVEAILRSQGADPPPIPDDLPF